MMFKSAFRRYLATSTAIASLSLASALPTFAQTEDSPEIEEEVVVVVGVETEEANQEEVIEDKVSAANVAEIEITETVAPALWLGIQLKPVDGDLAAHLGTDSGIFVISVIEGSPADKAKIQEGDIILECSGTKLEKVESIREVLAEVDGEEPTVELKILRHGKPKTIVAGLAPRPEDLAEAQVHELERVIARENSNVRNLQEFLSKRNGNAFEFVSPGTNIWVMGNDAEEVSSGDVDVKITKQEDGKSVTITVEKSNDEPVKCTVTEDGDTKEYTGDEIKDLPKHIRVMVDPLLKRKATMRLNLNRSGADSLKARALAITAGKIDDQAIAEIARKIAAEATENAEMIRRDAQIVAEEAAEKVAHAREKAAVARFEVRSRASSEINELRELVNELKAELAKLRKQIDADK
ncbi:MAG: hypothetical protein Aurels2KO_13490 [Aureliella sp.]